MGGRGIGDRENFIWHVVNWRKSVQICPPNPLPPPDLCKRSFFFTTHWPLCFVIDSTHDVDGELTLTMRLSLGYSTAAAGRLFRRPAIQEEKKITTQKGRVCHFIYTLDSGIGVPTSLLKAVFLKKYSILNI